MHSWQSGREKYILRMDVSDSSCSWRIFKHTRRRTMPKDIEECVNYRLREERLSRQWSQQEIADHIGATPNTVSRWELGITSPSPYFRTKLCQLFGKTSEELGFNSEMTEASTVEEKFSDLAIPAFQRLIGRDELLKQLSLHLHTRQDSPFLALHGLPGAGKTAL